MEGSEAACASSARGASRDCGKLAPAASGKHNPSCSKHGDARLEHAAIACSGVGCLVQTQLEKSVEKSRALINVAQLAELKKEMAAANVDEQIILQVFEVAELKDLTVAQHVSAINRCKAKLEAMNARRGSGAGEKSDPGQS